MIRNDKIHKKTYKWGVLTAAILVCSVGVLPLLFKQSTIRTWDIQKNLMLLFFAGCVMCCLMGGIVKSKKWCITSLCVTALILLTWTYYYNPIDKSNESFTSFQQDSDALVYSRIEAQKNGISTGKYGLGRYSNILDTYSTYAFSASTPISTEDGSVVNGYNMLYPGIVVVKNKYTTKNFVVGNQIQFSSGECLTIVEVEETDEQLIVYVDSVRILSQETDGNLADIVAYNAKGKELPKGLLSDYKSSVGIQGYLFSAIAKITSFDPAVIFPFICSFLFALTVMCFLYLLQKKYNLLMTVCFFVVFWLSPWIVNFANSEFWVQFTWLLPAVFGLMISIWRKKKLIRWLGYGGVFFSILLKCLCGYEYLSFVMMGTIFPLLMDFGMSVAEKNWKILKKLFIVIICTGVIALLGFAAALLLHADLRGNGDILAGMQSIWEKDVLRRALGGDANNFAEVYRESIEASFAVVLQKYQVFSTTIIFGVPGTLFSLFSIVPLLLFMWSVSMKQKVMWDDMILYVLSLFSSISWFVLGKQHSYIHVHMNYVSWYYWFIPACFYIIVKQIYLFVTQKKDSKL